MLSKLIGRRRAATPPPRTIPDGERVYAIGDIHGRLDRLEELVALIDADDAARSPARTTIVLLGDLVDRGPDSAGVVERLRTMAASRDNMRFLLGNHEEIFLCTLDGDDRAARMFCRVGGRETALSYGIDEREYERCDYAELIALLRERVPAEHIAFLSAFEDMVTVGDYAFVHAGVDPARALDQQRSSELRWIRQPFLDHDTPLDRMIVHGHTISEGVVFRPHRIGVDTGTYQGGPLSALALEGSERWVLETESDEKRPDADAR